MKYLRIKNIGVIEPEALHLVGASTKREDNTKIGQFGSGNKYALAYLLRNNYELSIFGGLNKISLELVNRWLRDKEFKVLVVNGKETSITTEMGMQWQLWQAIRELYCNAKDEGEAGFDFVQNIEPREGETHFYIPNSAEIMTFIGSFDNYFTENKTVLFECEEGKILSKSGKSANIYRRGIRCFETTNSSVFDYDFNDINIDENRLVMYSWEVNRKIWSLVLKCDNEEVIKTVLHQCNDEKLLEGYIDGVISSSNASEAFKKVVESMRIAPCGYAGLLAADEKNNFVIVPTEIFKSIRGLMNDENVGDKFKVNNAGSLFREIEISALYQQTLKQAMEFFKESEFEIPFPIKICIFESKRIMGAAYKGTIYISDVCMEKGVQEVVNTICEEFIHLKYKVHDETRAFQTAVITEWISYMKRKNAYVI